MTTLAETLNNPELASYLDTAIPELVARGKPVFEGKDPRTRLAIARQSVDAAVVYAKDKGAPIACRDRCPACCIYSENIAVLPIELEQILDRVERDGRLEEVERRAVARRDRGKGACPLLSRNGRCTVYEERPLVCRGHHSGDLQGCRNIVKKEGDGMVPWVAELVAGRLAATILAHGVDTPPPERDLFTALPPAIAARRRQVSRRAKRIRCGRAS